MFNVFNIVRQLHEIIWFLYSILDTIDEELTFEGLQLINEIKIITNSSANEIEKANLKLLRQRAKKLMLKAFFIQREENKIKGEDYKNKDFAGKDLRKIKLIGADLESACLIGANLSGNHLGYANLLACDMRGTNIKGADLSSSMFITQHQVNASIGDENTKLPEYLERPNHWK